VQLSICSGGPLQGQIIVPGDKSISHRALIFNALSSGSASIIGLLDAEDVGSTARCLMQLGVRIEGGRVYGSGGRLSVPSGPLDCGNSGTTMRLLLGLLAGQDFTATLVGDASLSRRPMARITGPLAALGATMRSRAGRPPVTVSGGQIDGAIVRSKIASAQVKSAVMLACLQGEGRLEYTEVYCSRDHTERMLSAMGAQMTRTVLEDGSHHIEMACGQGLSATDVQVPGDISSAAFFMVAASIVPGSEILLQDVGLNPTRSGVLDVLRRMGASLELVSEQTVSGEPMGTLRASSSSLQGVEIGGADIPRLIDELPVIAVAAAMAEGETRIRDAAELRVKESDRIQATVGFLRGMGVEADETEDGMVISGRGPGWRMSPARVDAGGDHRIAMAALVAGLVGRGETVVDGADAIATSFPGFADLLEGLRA
jgi:3-phosphoshikimate 1-carboxyvinyltransferase